MTKPTLDKSRSIIQQIAAHKAQEVAERKKQRPLKSFIHEIQPSQHPKRFEEALQQKSNRPNLILEIKPASPSQGMMRPDFEQELPQILEFYQQYGVAISVLTDETFFGGGLPLLKTVTQNVTCPVLCKEFILDPYQIYEACEAGASAVLLIVKMLTPEQLTSLSDTAKQLNLTPVVEVQNETEIKTALAINPSVILINHRDLDTLTLDMQTVKNLVPLLPENILCIAASGISDRAMFQNLAPESDAFLVGSALMKEPITQWNSILAEWCKPF